MEWNKIEPDVWKPEKEGDEIQGVLIKVDTKSGKFLSTIYHLETLEGKQKVIFGTTVLDDRMSYINVGEFVKIIFKGTQKNTKGQDVKIFEVFRGQDKTKEKIQA